MSDHSRICIEGFHRTDAVGTSVVFAGSIRNPDALKGRMREEGVYSAPGAEPVVIMVDENEHGVDGNCLGVVGVAVDNTERLLTIERAILALLSVRDGLREAGHRDE